MLRLRTLIPTLFLALLLAPVHALPAESGEVFEKVVSVLDRWFYDKDFVEQSLPGLAAELRERAHAAPDAEAERAVVNELLAQIPTSHLALLSLEAYHRLGAELFGKDVPSFGLELALQDGHYHAVWLYEGGPADLAGIKRGDEVLSIDGLAPAESPWLDWSTDDAALPDGALHALLAKEGDSIQLELLRSEGQQYKAEVKAAPYSSATAAEASARIIEVDGYKLGYVHFWLFQSDKPSALLKSLLAEKFLECDGLILDLRGRGGSAMEIERMMKMLDPEKGKWGRPVVALTHRGTRSAKEVMALRLQTENVGTVVGERTAGAVIPAAFKKVGGGAVLMFPSMSLGHYTDLLEGKGVTPDVAVADKLAYSAGADRILAAGIKVLAAKCWAAKAVK